MKTKKYYHITSPENLISIMKNGLISNNNEIFLFENVSITIPSINKTIIVADHIAEQVGLSEYLMLEINPKGIKNELKNDNVGEFTSNQQWILNQNKIFPSYISVNGIYDTSKE